jgi:hypothetical protein
MKLASLGISLLACTSVQSNHLVKLEATRAGVNHGLRKRDTTTNDLDTEFSMLCKYINISLTHLS